jgi:SAM-dependent methyltransferase
VEPAIGRPWRLWAIAEVATDERREVIVSYGELLHEMFPDLDPVVDDLFLLEAHQIADLPERAPARELAAVLHAHPGLHRFLVTRHPPIEAFLSRLLTEHSPVRGGDLATASKLLVWELADWIAYQRAPGIYEAESRVDWDVAAVTEVVALEGKTVIDAGAGTGRVAFSVAPMARHVFAVEPVGTLRRFMRDKAAEMGIGNVFVLDGFLHAIPLPTAIADVLLTCQAIGWALPDELAEIERVVKPAGIAMHLFGAVTARSENPLHEPLVTHGYLPDIYQLGSHHIVRYWKRFGTAG